MTHGHKMMKEKMNGCPQLSMRHAGIEEIRIMGERNVIKAALLGAGTVGSGVYALS